MALILALQRTRNIRTQYPTWPHVKACLAAGPRMPTDYPLLQSVISMTAVGVACGANLPLLPSWMGAMAGGASLAFVTTLPTASGDLARSAGMRVYSLLEEVVTINAELRILPKAATVSGKIFDRIMILDRKHRIKDKIVTVFSWTYDQVSRTASKVQADMNEEDGDDRDAERKSQPRRREGDWRDEPSRGGERRDRGRDERRNDGREQGERRDEPRR